MKREYDMPPGDSANHYGKVTQKGEGDSPRAGVSRRTFLKLTSAGVVLPTLLFGPESASARNRVAPIPSYLPRRLAICYYGWGWITTALPDEAFGDLDRAVRETKERGFNCIRAEMGLNWMFNLEGRRRGRLRFADWVPGISDNLQCVNGRGGGEFDVFDRVMDLFEIAAKYDIYVIMTSWEYQDAITQLADAHIRNEILSVPYSERLMQLARQYDRLLLELKRRKLHRNIAQVEIINELNSPPIVCSSTSLPLETMALWTSGFTPQPACSDDVVWKLASDAIQYLRQRHPDLLVTVDGLVGCSSLERLCPADAQVADHHAYSDGVVQAFWRKCGLNGFSPASPPDPNKNAFLKSVLKRDVAPWDEFVNRAQRIRHAWWGIDWLYANLETSKFDEWCTGHFAEYEETIKQSLKTKFECAGKFAASRRIPLVVDEGYILYPPLKSRFVTTPEARRGEEYGVDAAIATGHWGIIPTAYFRPDTPVWTDERQSDWIRRINKRILDN